MYFSILKMRLLWLGTKFFHSEKRPGSYDSTQSKTTTKKIDFAIRARPLKLPPLLTPD